MEQRLLQVDLNGQMPKTIIKKSHNRIINKLPMIWFKIYSKIIKYKISIFKNKNKSNLNNQRNKKKKKLNKFSNKNQFKIQIKRKQYNNKYGNKKNTNKNKRNGVLIRI